MAECAQNRPIHRLQFAINQAFAPLVAPLWIHWALRCPHGCLQEETNSCHWCVQLLQCLLGVPDWQRSLSNGKPGAAARGDGTLGLIRECPAIVTMDMWMSQNWEPQNPMAFGITWNSNIMIFPTQEREVWTSGYLESRNGCG